MIISILVVIIYVSDLISGGAIRTRTQLLGSYIWRRGTAIVATVTESGFVSSRHSLEAENSALVLQLAQLQERAAAYRVVKDENAELRKLLRVSGVVRGDDAASGITAPVVSSFIASPYGTFQIGAGSEDAVAVGDAVLSAENFVIGLVEETALHTSLVRELFASNVKSDALIRGISAVVEGRGGGNARTNLPRGSDVQVGDAVTSPVLGSRAIGIVGNISEDPGSAYKKANIYLPVNLSALQFVYVIKR